MRKFIIALSIIFFTLSLFVTYKALEISAYQSRYQYAPAPAKPENPSPEVQDTLEIPPKEQEVNQTSVKEPPAAISSLEDKLKNKNGEIREADKIEKPERQARVLAVLGAGSFSSGQDIINEALMNTIKELVPEIASSPGYRVVIEGHTDNIPIKTYSGKRYKDNMELSFLRAKEVALILEQNGIPLENISVTGYGDTRPVASNETDEGRIINRRVEVRLVPDDKDL